MASDKDLILHFLSRTRGYSQQQIEKLAEGVTRSDVSRWRRGEWTRLTEAKRYAVERYLARTEPDLLKLDPHKVLVDMERDEEVHIAHFLSIPRGEIKPDYASYGLNFKACDVHTAALRLFHYFIVDLFARGIPKDQTEEIVNSVLEQVAVVKIQGGDEARKKLARAQQLIARAAILEMHEQLFGGVFGYDRQAEHLLPPR